MDAIAFGSTGPGSGTGSGTGADSGTGAGAGGASGGGLAADRLIRAEYPDLDPAAPYLNTATVGLLPARTAAALRGAVDEWAAGRPDTDAFEAAVVSARAAYARIVGVAVERVALASTVAESVGLIAARLPPGAEVVVADRDFSSLVQPFAAREDLDLRIVPLDALADAVRPGTALVAVSAVQSADGRVADLPAIRAAAAAHGARTLLDGTQSVGWLPLCADDYDYVVCHAYKWLLSPHGACFLTVRAGAEPTLSPGFAGWYAADDPWEWCYGPVTRLAPGARRFDARPAYLPLVGAAASLSLIEEIGVPAIHAHDTALAARFRDGLTALGHTPVPGPSATVTVALPPTAPARLTAAAVRFSTPTTSLRFAFHLYNTPSDIDHTLESLA
ncbi:aminotransferase class V-fold PLP-dependent enzyme [Streptomyces sp. NPDC008317]|uniref:aminotransferase class V-fold PLP-dependent enzyme n=1 Tax=Streptomyces sp. NPDC008317 TaxID=3364827 RepID=UPI0036E5EC42